MYGITRKDRSVLFSIFFKCQNSIEKVYLFGSRARGDYKKNSDLDLAINFKSPVKNNIYTEFENSVLPYTVDVVNYSSNKNLNLERNIKKDGKLLFLTQGEISN